MKYGLKIFILFALLIFVGTFSLLVEGCEPALPLQIENQSSMSLTIYVRGHGAGNVGPNSSIKVKNVAMIYSDYLIEAKNSQGEIIYSRNFSTSELHDVGWKVVIPAS